MEILEKYAYLDLFRSISWKHAFLCNSIPFCDIFFLQACTKVEPNFFRLWVVFFAFSFSCCFCPFAEIADCLLGFQSVKEFSRQHHPNGKFLPSDEEGNYPPSFSLKFLNVSVYIWSSITLLWVSFWKGCNIHVNAWQNMTRVLARQRRLVVILYIFSI